MRQTRPHMEKKNIAESLEGHFLTLAKLEGTMTQTLKTTSGGLKQQER